MFAKRRLSGDGGNYSIMLIFKEIREQKSSKIKHKSLFDGIFL